MTTQTPFSRIHKISKVPAGRVFRMTGQKEKNLKIQSNLTRVDKQYSEREPVVELMLVNHATIN